MAVASDSMKFAAFLGVKDEIELVAATIDHLRAIGVDLIIAWDANSTDGTRLLLQQRQSDNFWLTQFDDRDPDIDGWYGMASQAANEVAAIGIDWRLFLDADEFWIPATGQLKDCTALESSDVLVVDRFNVPLVENGPAISFPPVPRTYDKLLLITAPIENFRAYLRNNPDAPWIRGVPVPKVMARPELIGSLSPGFHDVVPANDKPLRRVKPGDLLIAHVPFSTQTRFAQKIRNIRNFVEVHDQYLGADLAWHWRRWMSLADREGIEREFTRSTFDSGAICELRSLGVVRSAAEIFEERVAIRTVGN
jgi:hypothetical protein